MEAEGGLRERVLDEEHLRLSLTFGLMMGFMGMMFAAMPMQAVQGKGPPAPPVEIFWLFGGFLGLGVLFGVLEIIAGRCISIFTLLVLDRASVKRLYEERAA